ncbi:GYDIA family GHMP kinase [Mariniflexile gromovii]|uniref:GHMP kinase n=1 Tax=Mariniflexile gromovii TaxID=362523 RepID=A0ABS4BY19_9FLAO|nr:GYDIA family GHMP kinase [Mariniflexile gromovii]MBP0905480.1 GHMP kinase [Mariniflexile gromovii]
MQKLYSNGKLLITGEYVVLDGALSLAIPTKFGQSLTVEPVDIPKISWKSFNSDGSIWFEDTFPLHEMASSLTPRNEVSQRIIQILNTAKILNPDFLNTKSGFKISTDLTFPKNWGLGTSSTLINNISQWANVNAFELLEKTFGGSGYDIACAQNNLPITYQLKLSDCTQRDRSIIKVDFNPNFKDHLYFIYLNKKQNSRDGIASYNDNKHNIESVVSEINHITTQIIDCKTLEAFEILITQHESIISKTIKQKTVKDILFSDFNGSIKSLGAWGGDFVLATSQQNPTSYFKNKGFDVIVPYKDMVLDF